MESLLVRHLISATWQNFPIRCPLSRFHMRRIGTQIHHFRFVLHAKKSGFVDFQHYAKPSHLLPVTEVKEYRETLLEKVVTSFKVGGFQSLYTVKLQTSSSYGSSLTDVNAGILLCLIDENGDSILQRIAAPSTKDHPLQSDDEDVSDAFHFQRGSVDEFTFEGPKLRKLSALWIGIESGQWRLGGVSLTVICQSKSPSENDKNGAEYIIFQYDFEVEDILLGEGSEIPMVELRPRLVAEICEDNFTLLNQSFSPSRGNYRMANKETMKDYSDLKFSLLLYDTIVILAGSLVASLLAGEDAALGFLTGGAGGFLYLLLLQRSVDGLQSPESVFIDNKENFDQIFGRLKSPVSSLGLALAFAIIAMKYSSGDGAMVLTPKELMFGMMGFLACKVSVVLAALRPMAMSLKENA